MLLIYPHLKKYLSTCLQQAGLYSFLILYLLPPEYILRVVLDSRLRGNDTYVNLLSRVPECLSAFSLSLRPSLILLL